MTSVHICLGKELFFVLLISGFRSYVLLQSVWSTYEVEKLPKAQGREAVMCHYLESKLRIRGAVPPLLRIIS